VTIYVGSLEAIATIGLRLDQEVIIDKIFKINVADSKRVNPCSNVISLNSYAFENVM
jgi:hypothetical protein